MDRLTEDMIEREHRLLLHVAGELSPSEVAELERELQGDPAAQTAMERVGELLTETRAGLAALDASEPMARAVNRASDRAVKCVFAWTEGQKEARVLRSTRRHPLAEGMVWRYARWPLAAAALLVVGLMVWTFSAEVPQNQGPIAEDTRAPVVLDPPEVAVAPRDSAAPSEPQFEAIAALFESYARSDGADAVELELAGTTSDHVAALRLLEEPDYE